MIPPILCYHKIDTRFELGVTRLGPRVFARQMAALAARGYRAIGPAALAERVRGALLPAGAARAPREVVITFDDGYEALDRYAFPVVADHGFTALVFVITDFVGQDNRWDVRYGGRAFAHLTWEQLGRWGERGIEVHSHSATHRRLTWLSDDALAEELGRSRNTIARELGRAPAGVCYPFNAVDGRVRRAAAAAGYTIGFAGPGAGSDPLSLARLPVYGWDTAAPPLVIRQGVAGGLARGAARMAGRFAVVTSALRQR